MSLTTVQDHLDACMAALVDVVARTHPEDVPRGIHAALDELLNARLLLDRYINLDPDDSPPVAA